MLPQLLAGREKLYYRSGSGQERRVQALIEKSRNYHRRTGKVLPNAVIDLAPLLGEMRLRKSSAEIESLRAACSLSAEGHREAMRFAHPDLAEYQVQAAMEYVWREGGHLAMATRRSLRPGPTPASCTTSRTTA